VSDSRYGGGRLRLLAPLRVPAFALLWSGQTVSLAGDGVFVVALTWQALAFPGGAKALSLVLVARFLPATVLLLLGGVVSDRRSRRTTLLACDAVQCATLTALAVLTLTHHVRLWQLVAAAAVAGAASGFFLPASTALVPEVLPADRLLAANSLTTMSRLTAARLAGPVLGGVLVSAGGAGVAFAVDAGRSPSARSRSPRCASRRAQPSSASRPRSRRTCAGASRTA
jgi:MFS family permease